MVEDVECNMFGVGACAYCSPAQEVEENKCRTLSDDKERQAGALKEHARRLDLEAMGWNGMAWHSRGIVGR